MFAPRARVGLDIAAPSALADFTVVELKAEGRSARLERSGQQVARWVPTSALHRNIGALIVRIGAYSTEQTLLDPLAKSLLQYLRLLVTDDFVRLVSLRTEEELRRLWSENHAAYSHVIFVGHGRSDAIAVGNDWMTAGQLSEVLEEPNPEAKVVLSACCETGRRDFSAAISGSRACAAFIAPFGTVHGAVASQSFQTFFAVHFLDGRTTTVAFNQAAQSVPGAASFRLWRGGRLARS